MSTETRLIRDRSPGRPPWLSHSSWTLQNWCFSGTVYVVVTPNSEPESTLRVFLKFQMGIGNSLGVGVAAGSMGECSSPGSTFCADLFWYLFYHTSTYKIPVVWAKVPGYVTLNMHAPYVCGLQNWCSKLVYDMHKMCADTAGISCGTSHVTTKQCCKYTTLVDIKKCTMKSYSHSFRITYGKSSVSLRKSGK